MRACVRACVVCMYVCVCSSFKHHSSIQLDEVLRFLLGLLTTPTHQNMLSTALWEKGVVFLVLIQTQDFGVRLTTLRVGLLRVCGEGAWWRVGLLRGCGEGAWWRVGLLRGCGEGAWWRVGLLRGRGKTMCSHPTLADSDPAQFKARER